MKTVCHTCMHHCSLEPGQRGLCRARKNENGRISLFFLSMKRGKTAYRFHFRFPFIKRMWRKKSTAMPEGKGLFNMFEELDQYLKYLSETNQ